MQNVSIVGAGTMGNGIAHLFAQKGFTVQLIDTQAQQLERALKTIAGNLDRQVAKGLLTEEDKKNTLEGITIHQELGAGVAKAELVVEAATENTELKLNIFRHLDEMAPKGCILASNTSSISITRIASATRRPAAVIGLHFMNPVPVMKLIEVINGYATDPSVTKQMVTLAEKLGKTPCVVNDYPGFIANRILMPMINEAIYSLYEGVAEVREIDTVMRMGMAHPMGPLQLADFIGLDVCLSILRVLQEGFGNPKYAPCPLLVNMVTAGYLGVKSGEGFYKYAAGSKDLVVSTQFTRARNNE
jgi:3-hydroxybutyryl-CoA dehydrogenase